MSKKPISPLRQRLIDDITARRFSEDTKRDYVRNVRKFAAFLGRSPDTATSEDLRRYQLHMAQQQASPSMINAAIAALRFFFTVTHAHDRRRGVIPSRLAPPVARTRQARRRVPPRAPPRSSRAPESGPRPRSRRTNRRKADPRRRLPPPLCYPSSWRGLLPARRNQLG